MVYVYQEQKSPSEPKKELHRNVGHTCHYSFCFNHIKSKPSGEWISPLLPFMIGNPLCLSIIIKSKGFKQNRTKQQQQQKKTTKNIQVYTIFEKCQFFSWTEKANLSSWTKEIARLWQINANWLSECQSRKRAQWAIVVSACSVACNNCIGHVDWSRDKAPQWLDGRKGLTKLDGLRIWQR